ncbi:MAG: hypothetical protein SFU85_03715 [Candidatus Methylacidiphilales bacterium]|nr:hypothetical protein [Candidatus Methylacidiphilales bacterium]
MRTLRLAARLLEALFLRLPPEIRAHPGTYFGIGGVILLLDLVTGIQLQVSLLLFFPVALCSWYCGRGSGFTLAVVLSLGRLLIALYAEANIPLLYFLANTAIRLGVLSGIALLTVRAREALQLQERVRILEGILPMCSFCKNIRDEGGRWTRVESYISDRSTAQFSHGVCPDCARQHYGIDLNPGSEGQRTSG